MTRFGDTIKRRRLELGKSQAQVAEQLDISASGYAHIESGIRTTTAATARAICKVLDLGPPHPAVAAMEHIAAQDARDRGISLDEAYDELVGDMVASGRTFKAGGHDGDVDFWTQQLASFEQDREQWAATAAQAAKTLAWLDEEIATNKRALEIAKAVAAKQ